MKKIILIICTLFVCSFSAQMKNKDYSKIMKSTSIYELDAFLKDAHPEDPRRTILKPRLIVLIKEYMKNAHPADPRIKELQEKLVLLSTRPNTKISYEEMEANIKKKQIEKYKAELIKLNQQIASGGTPEQVQTTNIDSNNENSIDTETKTSVATTPTYTTQSQPKKVSGTSVGSMTSNKKNSEAEEYKALMNVSSAEHKNKTVKLLNTLFDNDPNSKECIVMIQNKSDCDIIVRITGSKPENSYKLPVPAHNENSIVVAKGDYNLSSVVCGSQYVSKKSIQKAIMVALGSGK